MHSQQATRNKGLSEHLLKMAAQKATAPAQKAQGPGMLTQKQTAEATQSRGGGRGGRASENFDLKGASTVEGEDDSDQEDDVPTESNATEDEEDWQDNGMPAFLTETRPMGERANALQQIPEFGQVQQARQNGQASRATGRAAALASLEKSPSRSLHPYQETSAR